MSTTPDSAVRTVRTCIEAHKAAFLDDLADWLRIPSVSADPARKADVRASAAWLAAKLGETGFPVTEIWDTPGAPAVFAHWPSADPDAPTVLVYGHHDVQPAAREDGWETDPFDPTVKGERLYGRGAADDKGQVFFHTLGVRAHLAATGRSTPAVHLKLLIEGEVGVPPAQPGGESGSPNFPALIEKHAARLPAGSGIRHEITFWGATRPCLTPLDHPALESVVRAMGRAFGTQIRFTREGGSGPAADLQDVLGVPVLFLGISVPSDGWHSVNEKVEIDLLMKGVETSAYLWSDLAEAHATGSWQQS
jgi:acetylornithine deacetylase/succinyl-diaminopimelate desuccinylase-like protein